MTKSRVLLIGGSDSSGGAGLEADQKVCAAHGVYALTATTALTAQNTRGVRDICHTPPEFVRKQIEANLQDIECDVVKTGMLASAETVKVVADALRGFGVKKVVVDPVMVSTSGSHLLPSFAIATMRERLFPLTTLLTPNIPEALLILSDAGVAADSPRDLEEMKGLARKVRALGPEYVLLKGGHLPLREDGTVAEGEGERKRVVDILVGGRENVMVMVEGRFVESRHTHGTGCSLASAIAANLANGLDMPAAVRSGCRFVEAGIRTAPGLGHGNGPINHFHSTYTLPFAPNYFIEYLLHRPDVQPRWREYTEHPFVQRLGDATLPVELFRDYLVQDYLFLVQFARATALGGYKARDIDEVNASASGVANIVREMAMHIEYCAGFSLSREQILATEEKTACTAYTRYVLDIGATSDWLALQVAMLPCLLGYNAVARCLHDDPATVREGNTYWKWIESYVSEEYEAAVRTGCEAIERHVVLQSPHRIEELVGIFRKATVLETGFWEMGGK